MPDSTTPDPAGTPRALLLPGSIGAGHGALAAAFAVALHERGWRTDTVDAMALLGGWQHRAGEQVFRTLLSVPGAFDALHFAVLREGRPLAGWLDRQSTSRVAAALVPELRRIRPRLVVSVFATAAAAVSAVRPQFPDVRTVTLCSDVNPHRLWVHPGTDCYLVGSDVSAAFVRRFDPDAHVVVTPPPVRPAFYAAPSRADARARLGVDPDAPVALLMAGAWGLAPLADLAAALSSAGVTTLAVAGRNATLERQLLARAQADPRLRSFGFTDDVPALMAAADVVVTTPGDTCSEARVVGRRLVLLDVLAGHGRENLQHELEQGDAAVAGPDPALLPAIVRRSLAAAGDPQPQAWRARQWQDAVDRAVGAGIDPAAGDGARAH